MKIATVPLIIAVLFAGAALANAAGVSEKTPGDQMQDKGSLKGTSGASGYAPGQKMHQKGSLKGTEGASGYAPGHHATTGSKSDTDTDDMTKPTSKSK